MAKSYDVDKRKLFFDGTDLPGLTAVDGISSQAGQVEVATIENKVLISDGVYSIPPVTATYLIGKNSGTVDYFEAWKQSKETRTVTQQYLDGAGNIMRQELWTDVELSGIESPAFDASAVDKAQITVTLLPNDIVPISV